MIQLAQRYGILKIKRQSYVRPGNVAQYPSDLAEQSVNVCGGYAKLLAAGKSEELLDHCVAAFKSGFGFAK